MFILASFLGSSPVVCLFVCLFFSSCLFVCLFVYGTKNMAHEHYVAGEEPWSKAAFV